MKELSIEEKARRYDEAIKVAHEYWDSPRTCIDIDVLPKLFPELAESEDEKIRKEIINYFYDTHDDDEERAKFIAYLEKQGEQKSEEVDNLHNYLYGEQNLAWSEEDETRLNDAIDACKAQYGNMSYTADWLLSIKERVQPQPKQELNENGWTMQDEEELDIAIKTLEEVGQYSSANWLKNVCLVPRPKQEWSEEDSEHINSLIERLDGMCKEGATFTRTRFAVSEDIDWLKSLRPQNRWKPSEER